VYLPLKAICTCASVSPSTSIPHPHFTFKVCGADRRGTSAQFRTSPSCNQLPHAAPDATSRLPRRCCTSRSIMCAASASTLQFRSSPVTASRSRATSSGAGSWQRIAEQASTRSATRTSSSDMYRWPESIAQVVSHVNQMMCIGQVRDRAWRRRSMGTPRHSSGATQLCVTGAERLRVVVSPPA
jgi:hypothetical protein